MPRSAALLCFILFIAVGPGAAQTEIHRCIGANGGAVFTDQPCAALQATAVGETAVAANAGQPSSSPPAPILCAASLGQLRHNVIDAFATRDANRLAGLMLWGGYGRGAAIADIRSLDRMMKQPLLDVSSGDDAASGQDDSVADAGANDTGNDADAAASPAAEARASSHQLVLHTAGNDDSGNLQELRFEIVQRAGCLWLRNAD
jgi:hypothetical protein